MNKPQPAPIWTGMPRPFVPMPPNDSGGRNGMSMVETAQWRAVSEADYRYARLSDIWCDHCKTTHTVPEGGYICPRFAPANRPKRHTLASLRAALRAPAPSKAAFVRYVEGNLRKLTNPAAQP